MYKNDRKRLRKILFIGLTAVCVIFVFALFLRDNRKRATAISIASLQDATVQSAQRVDDLMERAQKELGLTVEFYEEMMTGAEISGSDLQNLTEKSPFANIGFVNGEGISLNAEGETEDVSASQYYLEGMKGNSGVDVVSDLTADENAVVFYAPLHYENKIIGVLTGIYKESQMREILSSTFFGENARTFLCMRDGTIIASCNPLTETENILDDGSFGHKVEEENREGLRNALSTGTDYEFQYEATAGKGNAYVLPLDNNEEWMLIQTFPSQVTTKFVNDANLAGAQLLAELIGIFLVCLVAILVNAYIQKKKLTQENAEKTYVIDAITQIYKTFVKVDLEKNTYQYLAGTKPRYDGIAVSGSYDDFRAYLLEQVEDKEEKETLERLYQKAVLQKNMNADTVHLRYEYRSKNMKGKWDSNNLICMKRVDGIVTEILFIYQDVTHVKEREQRSYEALKEAYQAVESANQAKSNFLSNMSHDIRTPMNAIMGMTAIAAMNIENQERVKDCLNKITVSSRHLLGLINEVLDMSKIESGKFVLTEEEFNLSDVVESIIAIFLPQTEAKKQNFKVEIADVTHEGVIGDSMRLEQIFINVIGNAVKFTPEGGEISFHISEKPSNMRGCGCYVFTVTDNGIGMEESFLDKLFEPFVRADNSRTGKVEGTGLGMPIVKNIVRMMNGDIQVKSRINEGSQFTITLYLQLNHAVQEDVKGLENLSVLVADDDEKACEGACVVLRDIGMNADWVLSGDEAIERLLQAKETAREYAAVILDWKMPGKDGLETAREIRAKVGEEVPIIILSAFDYSSVEQEARAAGVNAFITKPLFRSRLIYVMKSLMLSGSEEETDIAVLQNRNYAGKRVLLVEDNELNMEIAQELLTQAGLSVEKAENGQIAVDTVLEKPAGYFDLIFMDIQMPVMNGYEAAKTIRGSSREDMKTIPIIAMSADAFTDDVKHALDVGMNGHVAKPVEIEKLLKALDEWI